MKRTTLIKSLLIGVLSIFLFACQKDLPPGEYDSNEVGKIKKVVPGMIISKRPVKLRKTDDTSKPGTLVDTGYNQTRGVEYVIKLSSGTIISVVQNEDLRLKNKQKILVIYGRNTRVVADNGSDDF